MATEGPTGTAASMADEPATSSFDRACRNCGAFVTRRFARGYGSNNGAVYACLECATARDLRTGAAKEPNHE